MKLSAVKEDGDQGKPDKDIAFIKKILNLC